MNDELTVYMEFGLLQGVYSFSTHLQCQDTWEQVDRKEWTRRTYCWCLQMVWEPSHWSRGEAIEMRRGRTLKGWFFESWPWKRASVLQVMFPTRLICIETWFSALRKLPWEAYRTFVVNNSCVVHVSWSLNEIWVLMDLSACEGDIRCGSKGLSKKVVVGWREYLMAGNCI